VRDRAATRALIFCLLSLPFGILSPFAILSSARSLRRAPSASALIGLIGGILGALFLVAGVAYWMFAL